MKVLIGLLVVCVVVIAVAVAVGLVTFMQDADMKRNGDHHAD